MKIIWCIYISLGITLLVTVFRAGYEIGRLDGEADGYDKGIIEGMTDIMKAVDAGHPKEMIRKAMQLYIDSITEDPEDE